MTWTITNTETSKSSIFETAHQTAQTVRGLKTTANFIEPLLQKKTEQPWLWLTVAPAEHYGLAALQSDSASFIAYDHTACHTSKCYHAAAVSGIMLLQFQV